MSEELNETVDKPRRWIVVAILVGVGAITLEVLTAVATYYAFGTWSDRGNFGQMFGAVSALFSAFALAAVAISIVLQSDELSLQRQELVFSRRELQRSADAQVATVELFRKQLAATQVSLDEERQRRRQVSAPIFKFVEAPAGPQPIMTLKLINEGAAIRDLIIRSKGQYQIVPRPSDVLQSGHELSLTVSYQSQPSTVEFELSCVDAAGEPRHFLVTCDIGHQKARTSEP